MPEDITVTIVTTLVDDELRSDTLSLNRSKAGGIEAALDHIAGTLERRGVPLTSGERLALAAAAERDGELQINEDILVTLDGIGHGRMSEMAAILQANYSFTTRTLRD